VADLRRDLTEKRAFLAKQFRNLNVVMRGHGANGNFPVLLAGVVQVSDSPKVDECFWLGQTQLHRWNQAVPAGQDFCVFARSKRGEGFVERRGAQIIESCWNHGRLLCLFFPFAVVASLIAAQIFSGSNGKSRWRTPSGESASITAFAMAGVAPMV